MNTEAKQAFLDAMSLQTYFNNKLNEQLLKCLAILNKNEQPTKEDAKEIESILVSLVG